MYKQSTDPLKFDSSTGNFEQKSSSPIPGSPFSSSINRVGKAKVFSALFGMLLLAAGLGAGLVLVAQPQLLGQKAQVLKYGTCQSGVVCSLTQISGSSLCLLNDGTPSYCCPKGYEAPDNACLKTCDSGVVCSRDEIGNSSKCASADGYTSYCCSKGQIEENNNCVFKSTPMPTSTPYVTCSSITNPTSCYNASNCSWKTPSCSSFSVSQCPGKWCSVNSVFGECSKFTSESTCMNQVGCSVRYTPFYCTGAETKYNDYCNGKEYSKCVGDKRCKFVDTKFKSCVGKYLTGAKVCAQNPNRANPAFCSSK